MNNSTELLGKAENDAWIMAFSEESSLQDLLKRELRNYLNFTCRKERYLISKTSFNIPGRSHKTQGLENKRSWEN